MKLRQILGSVMLLAFSVHATAAGYDWTSGDYTNTASITGNPGVVGAGSSLGVFANQGTISSTGNSGFWLINGAGEISNTGTITTSAASYYSGIYLDGVTSGRFTLTTLTNSGTISSTGSNGYGIYNGNALIGTLVNDGTISGSYLGVVNTTDGTIDNIENRTTGKIIGTIDNSSGSTIGTVANSGKIGTSDGTTYDGGDRGISNSGTISTLNNTSSGVILGTNSGVYNDGIITNLINAGTISGQANPGISNNGNIVALNNSGSISGVNGLDYAGSIGTLTNTGTISGSSNGIQSIGFSSSIETLTNFGMISGGTAGIYLSSFSFIRTLNNAQSGLTIIGALPVNYNVIVNSNTSYGRLTNFGSGDVTNFGIYNGSTLTKGTYASVLSGFTASNISDGSKSGIYNGTAWSLLLNSGTTWDLIVQSSATNTLASVQQNSNGLATVYNQQAAAYQAALSYDCQVYDEMGLCVSVGGRYTYAGPSPSSNQQAGLVVLGYKPVQTFRVGAFADQSVNISTPTGFSQSKTSPMWGFFAKWHKNKDETGLGVQASAVTSASSLTATRPQLFNTEAGSGTTQFNGQGYQLTTNYHQPVTNNTSVVPYLGLRYTRINAGAYTENTTATVTSPLSYNAMAQNTFSAIAGLGVRSHLAEKLTGTASVGIQQNLNYSMGNYAGTSNITGLESFSVQMPGNVNSMATATAGMFYDINKRERFGLNVLWQQQPFIATNTTTALATYTIGF